MKKSEEQPYYVVQSVDRVLSILQAFIDERGPLGVTEVAARLKLHKSVAHRMMATLQYHGYLKKNDETDKYIVGAKAFELGSVFANSTNLIEEGKLAMVKLVAESGMESNMAVLENGSVLYLASIEQEKARHRNAAHGQRRPIHLTALGKSLLAWLPSETIAETMRDYVYERRTSKTIGSFEQFARELEIVRERGYAIDDEESVLGMRCVSAPVRDYTGDVVAAISISGTSKLIPSDKTDVYGGMTMDCANLLSRRLGYSGR